MNLGLVLLIAVVVFLMLVVFGVVALPALNLLEGIALILVIVALVIYLAGVSGGFNWPWRRGP